MRVRRISEELQKDEVLMSTLRRIGAVPDKVVGVSGTDDGVLLGSGGEAAEIDSSPPPTSSWGAVGDRCEEGAIETRTRPRTPAVKRSRAPQVTERYS